MIRWLIQSMRAKYSWYRHGQKLQTMSSMAQFEKYITAVQPAVFLQYQAASPTKRAEFQAAVHELNLQLAGITFLDLCPGYGDALDICHEQGAAGVEFFDIEPFFYAYNRLKAFTRGYRLNNMTGDLKQLGMQRFDLIWAKGCTSADDFMRPSWRKRRQLALPSWLAQLDGLVAPGGQIVLTPHWRNNGQRQQVSDVHGNYFTKTLLSHAYTILPSAPRNLDPAYPLTFYKRLPP